MLETEFTVETQDLLSALLQIKKLQKKYFEKGMCKLRVMSGGVEISTVGLFLCIPGETTTLSEVIVPLKLLYSFVVDCSTPTVNFKFRSKELICGSVVYTLPNISIQKWIDKPMLDFSINHTDLELLGILFTKGNASFVDPVLVDQLNAAQIKLSRSITQAFNSLSDYKIKRSEIEAMVKQRIISSTRKKY